MISTSSLYEACRELFLTYPLTVRAANRSGTIHLLVLLVHDDSSERFFVLSRDCREDRPRFSLRPWHDEGVVDIAADDPGIPDATMEAVIHGVPIPQDEYLFGWRDGDHITALVVFYTRYTPTCPEPRWAVMPSADEPEERWPPFATERQFGHWFWEHYRDGNVVCVSGIVGENPGTVFWVDTQAILGSNCCAVGDDIVSPGGYTLRRGRYVYQDALLMNKPVPSLEVLLADTSKADLAPRFQPPPPVKGQPLPCQLPT